ncbi:MAG: serine hydrolase domain-containing protein [Verrucomicrobiota bacterium]
MRRSAASGFLILLVLCHAVAGTLRAGELSRASIQAAADYSSGRRGDAMLVIQNGREIFSQYANGSHSGEAHKIYSGTKGFWIVAALQAEKEGILKLDERVSETLPEWRLDPRKARVTIRELLNFTSGLDAEFSLHGDGVPDRNAVALRVPMMADAGRRFIYGPAALQVYGEALKRKLAPHGQDPIGYLERKVLKPLGLGSQRYKKDRRGNPLLATGFQMTATQWARMGRLILAGGAPVVESRLLAQALRGSGANPAFGMGFWNNRAASQPGAREFDIENMLERKAPQQDWQNACLCRAAPPDLVAAIGSGYQRLFVIPSLDLIVVRQGRDARFSDGEFLRLLLGKQAADR